MSHRINARLDDSLDQQVQELRALTKQTTTGVIESAIGLYHQTMLANGRARAQLLRDSGFVGCAEGPEDLSETTRTQLADSLRAKT